MTEASTTPPTETTTSTTTDAGATGAAPEAWYSKFSDESLRTNPTIQRYDGPEGLAKAHLQLEKRFGIDPNRRLDLPESADDKDGWKAVYAKLGVPEKPEDYGLSVAETATPGDKAILEKFMPVAHGLNVTPAQAKGLLEWFTGEAVAAREAEVQAFNQAAEQGVASLKKEWGQAYEPRLKEIGAVIKKYGDEALAKELDASGIGRYPNLAVMLGKMMDRMAEPSAAGGQAGLDGSVETRALTPDQAKAEVRKLEADPVEGKALRDASHPQHKDVVQKRNRLLRMTA